MDSSSAPIRMWRSTTVAAFLSVGLMGCGNAQAGTAQASEADTTVQDWETQPKLWVPHPILIPRSSPPVLPADSSADSVKADTAKADSSSATAHPAKADSNPNAAAKPAALAKPRKSLFNISPRDSALWPVKGPEPLPGSLIPEHRIVAFYGNPLSKRMGILGEIEPDEMLRRLEQKATEWAAADSGQKVLPALHLIATVAQGYPGPARKYRLQMPDLSLIHI